MLFDIVNISTEMFPSAIQNFIQNSVLKRELPLPASENPTCSCLVFSSFCCFCSFCSQLQNLVWISWFQQNFHLFRSFPTSEKREGYDSKSNWHTFPFSFWLLFLLYITLTSLKFVLITLDTFSFKSYNYLWISIIITLIQVIVIILTSLENL